MIERITSNNPLTKVFRIVLVFALVFWCSFRVECLAFGDVFVDDGSGHEEGTLEDFTVWSFITYDEKGIDGSAITSATDTADGKVPSLQLSTLDDAHGYLVVPSWSDDTSGDTFIGSFFEASVEGSDCLAIDTRDGAFRITASSGSAGSAVVTWKVKDKLEKLISPTFAEQHKNKAFEASIKFNVVPPTASAPRVFDADGAQLTPGNTITLTEEQRESYSFSALVDVHDGVSGDLVGAFPGGLPDATRGAVSDPIWSIGAGGESIASIDADGTLHMSGAGSVTVICSVEANGIPNSFEFNVVSEGSGGEEPSGGSEPPGPGGESSGSSEPPGPGGDDPGNSGEFDQGEDHAQSELHVIVNNALSDNADSGQTDGDQEEEGGADGSASSEASSPSGGSATTEGNQNSSGSGAAADASGASASKDVIEKTYSVDELRELAAGTEARYSLFYGQGDWRTVKGTGPYLDVVLRDAGISDTSQIDSLEFEGMSGTVTMKWADIMASRSYFPNAPTGDYSYAEIVAPMVAIDSCILPRAAEPTGNEGEGTTPPEGEGTTPPEGEGGAPGGDADAQEGDVAGNPGSGASPEPEGGSADSENPSAVTEPDMVSNTRFRILMGALDDPSGDVAPDSLRWVNTIRVNLIPTHEPEPEPEPDTPLKVLVDYKPVPKGVTAALKARPNSEIGFSTFELYWQYKSGEGGEWIDVLDASGERLMVQTLRVPTSDETIGRIYRACMRADDPTTGERVEVHSKPVTITEGYGFTVQIEYDPPAPGQTAIFEASVSGIDNADKADVWYEWQMSTDDGETWTTISGSGTNADEHKAQLYVPTVKRSSSSGGSSGGDQKPVLTLIRVIAHASGDRTAESDPVMLTTQSDEGDEEGTGDQKPTGEEGSSSAAPDKPESGQPSSPEGAEEQQPEDEQLPEDQQKPEEQKKPESQNPGDTGSGSDEQKPQSGSPSNPASQEVRIVPDTVSSREVDPNSIYINSEVSEKVQEQIEEQKEETESKTPGARWTEINTVNPYSQDVQRIMAENPFAPFGIPVGLGIIAAGGLEKLLSFRRQL